MDAIYIQPSAWRLVDGDIEFVWDQAPSGESASMRVRLSKPQLNALAKRILAADWTDQRRG
jgi:hypothetical protein